MLVLMASISEVVCGAAMASSRVAHTCSLSVRPRQLSTLAQSILRSSASTVPAVRSIFHYRSTGIIAQAESNGTSGGIGRNGRLIHAGRSRPVGATAVVEEEEIDSGREQLERMLKSLDGDEEEEVEVEDLADVDESLLLTNNGLSDITIKALEKKGIKALFPIQKEVFNPAMQGKDLIARARTGSGKTIAFALPVIEKIMQRNLGQKIRGRRPQCIVLAPTRELAAQVHREMQAVAPTLDCGCYYGGTSYVKQERELRAGMDIVVGTPGRVIDLINKNTLDLSEIRFVILDEADQMLNVGFEKDVEHILSTAPEERQTMLFSATMPKWVKNLVKRFQRNPVTVDLVGDEQTGRMAESIRALAVQVSNDSRRSVLVDILTVYGGVGKSIVFTQTKREADEVAAGVAQAMPCEALHGDISQQTREKILSRFRAGKFTVLVATDVAARGLDISDVDLVVHYELPQEPEGFLHRSGRTGRAGKSGTALAMYTAREIGYFKRILRETETTNIQFVAPPTPKQVMHAAAQQVVNRLSKVDADVKEFFLPAARMILGGENSEERLAAALAALSGRLEVPQERSLLTQEEGKTTVRMMAEKGQFTGVGQILGTVRRLVPELPADGVGRVRMVSEAGMEGAIFDLPSAHAATLLAEAASLTDKGIKLDRPKTVPPEDDKFGSSSRGGSSRGGRDGYGRDRRSGGGGGRGGGGYGGGRDSFRSRGGRDGGFRDSGRDSFRDRDSFQDRDGGSRGSRDRDSGFRDSGSRGSWRDDFESDSGWSRGGGNGGGGGRRREGRRGGY